MKRKSLILLVLAAGVLSVAVAVAVIWNKPHETVENKEGEKITAMALTEAFLSNEHQANAIYLNKVLEVSGRVAEISTNQDHSTVILLESDDPFSGVQCTMKEDPGVQEGEEITVKGFCNGYTTVVLLSDCIVTSR